MRHASQRSMVLVACLFPSCSDDCPYHDARNLEVARSVNTDRAVLGVAADRLEFDATVPVLAVIPLQRNILSDSCYHDVSVSGIPTFSYRDDVA